MFTLIAAIIILIGVAITVFLVAKSRPEESDDIKSRVIFSITLPKRSEEKDKEIRSFIAPMETVFSNLAGIEAVVGKRHLTFEMSTQDDLINFYVTVPSELAEFVEKQITSQYPDAVLERVMYPNIFQEQGKVAAAQLTLKRANAYPIRTYLKLESDGMNALTNALSKLTELQAGAAIQVVFRPAPQGWQKVGQTMARNMMQGKGKENSFGADLAKNLTGIISSPNSEAKPSEMKRLTSFQEEVISLIEQKAAKAGFEVVVRVVSSAAEEMTARANLRSILDSFLQFGSAELNQLAPETIPENEIIRNYILRQFGTPKPAIMNSEELASLYHLPTPLTETPNIRWLKAKRLPAPDNLPKEGIVIGKNVYRGTEKMIRIKTDDRRRHMYMIGKTGTGKSTWLQNMALQDIVNGDGVCFIDPHGTAIEWILERIPKDRIDDVIHFYPPDIDRPLGLNLLEAENATQRDMVVSEMIAIFYKLFDPSGSGQVVGPIFEHYMRNAMLLLMSDPTEGATIIDIPRLFTDASFRERKLTHVTDPTVQRFWKEEFEQAKKSNQVGELFSYIISKIGRFISNEMMRNIVGQPKSAFDLRDVMDNRKILLVNLAKGLTSDINSYLLGFIFVSKIQMAALSRADNPAADYPDFYLYIDEFQNVTTDSIATILSEARKYRLDMIMAHQFMAQLEDKIRDAVLGNVGTMVAFTIGAPDAQSLRSQFEPEVTENDLINIENRNAYIKLMVDGAASRPFTLSTLPPMGEGNPKISEAIKQLSRLKYGRDRRIVEKQVGERIKFSAGSNPRGSKSL